MEIKLQVKTMVQWLNDKNAIEIMLCDNFWIHTKGLMYT